MNSFYRALISLAAVFPISIPYAYMFSADIEYLLLPEAFYDILPGWFDIELAIVLAVVAINIIVGYVVVWALGAIAGMIGDRPVKVLSVKLSGSDSLLGYLPYVLPLFVTQPEVQNGLGWAVGVFLLFVIAWASGSITFSPLLNICGLRFYEVQFAGGYSATLLIKGKILKPLELKSAAKISDSCFYGLR